MASKKKEVATSESDSNVATTSIQAIDQSKFPNRIFILIEKIIPKHKSNPEYACKLLSSEEVLTAHETYIDGEKYNIVAIPDIYRAGATNDAYKCMEYIGYWETIKNQK